MNQQSLFELVGGKAMIMKVHKIFYDKIYADPWIGQFFRHISQETIENQQTDFMMQAMGGPELYAGAFPVEAHKHMFITEELFNHRFELLAQSLKEAGLSTELSEKWLKIDGAFKKGIVKSECSECKKRFATDDILDFKKPA